MAQDKPQEIKQMTQTQRNAELIINRLVEFLSIRFDHAARINLALKPIKQELLYHETSNIRRCLLGEKIYGPSRQAVADIMLSDDEKRRKGLMSPSDQTSIQVELVSHCQDQKTESTRGQVRFHDLKGFYAAIDHSIADFMDLVETWIWWDITDTFELIRFEQKLNLVAITAQGKLNEEKRKQYTLLIAEDAATQTAITDEDVIRYELKQISKIREQWAYRRSSERGFMFVLKREELPVRKQGDIINQLFGIASEYQMVECAPDDDDTLGVHYAPQLHMTPEKITKSLVLDYLQRKLFDLERESVRQADLEVELGPPYNYKERLQEQMEGFISELVQKLAASGKLPTQM